MVELNTGCARRYILRLCTHAQWPEICIFSCKLDELQRQESEPVKKIGGPRTGNNGGKGSRNVPDCDNKMTNSTVRGTSRKGQRKRTETHRCLQAGARNSLNPTNRRRMPDIAQGNQVFDLDFHPHSDHVYTALLTGEIRSHSYSSEDGNCTLDWSIRPTKRSCRGLALNATGDRLYSVSKDKNLQSVRSE